MSIIEKIKDTIGALTGDLYDNSECIRPTPCQDCGACCSYFRIDFDTKNNPQVPKEYVIKIDRKKSAIKGAENFKGTCSAFSGEIGVSCKCNIYENRPDVCRKFAVWLKNGKQNPRCYKARIAHGLPGEIS